MTGRLRGQLIGGLLAIALLGGGGTAAALLRHGPPEVPATRHQPGHGHAGGATAAPAPVYSVSGLRHPASGEFFGVETPGPASSLAGVRSFAASLGVRPNIIGRYVSWGAPLDVKSVTTTWSYGALPYLVWEPYGTTLQSIASGDSDGYIAAFAIAVRDLKIPVVISFGHEMNGNWYPWGVTGATGSQFIAAWRHIHNLFTSAQANNVIWVWNPNCIDALPQVQLKGYYPGDGYVDWVGITGYFTATTADTFAGLYGPTIAEIRAFTHKPLIIPEMAVASMPQAGIAIASLISTIKQDPGVLGVVWFDFEKAGVDWRVETRPAIRAALATGLAGLHLLGVRAASEVRQ